LAFSYWFDKPRFLTEGRLATVLIIPSSWGSQLGASNWHHQSSNQVFWRRCWGTKKNNLPRQLGAVNKFSGAVAGEKEDFCKGSFTCTSFTLFIVLLYFIFSCIFLSKTHKN
jgi:hypothetical protein